MTPIQYRITREHWADVCHLELSKCELKLLVLLRSINPFGSRAIEHSTKALADLVGCSVRTIQRSIKKLLALDLVKLQEKTRGILIDSVIPKSEPDEPKATPKPKTAHPWRETDGTLNPRFKVWLLNQYLMPIWTEKRGYPATDKDVTKYVHKREGTKQQPELEQRWSEFRQSIATLPTVEQINLPPSMPYAETLTAAIGRLNIKLGLPSAKNRQQVEAEIQQKWTGILHISEGKVCQIAPANVLDYLKQNNGSISRTLPNT